MKAFLRLGRRLGRWPLASLLLAVVLLAASGAAGERVEAAIGTFEVAMVGANEVPAASGPGSGLARVTFNDVTRELTYVVWMRGLSSGEVTASHIHRAPAGTAGPPVYTLATSGFDVISGSITLTEADVADLRAGSLYVNIHSKANPSGFARAQLILPKAAAIAAPSTGDAGLADEGNDRESLTLLYGLAALAFGALATVLIRVRRTS